MRQPDGSAPGAGTGGGAASGLRPRPKSAARRDAGTADGVIDGCVGSANNDEAGGNAGIGGAAGDANRSADALVGTGPETAPVGGTIQLGLDGRIGGAAVTGAGRGAVGSSLIGRSSAKLRRSPLTEYWRAGNVTLRPPPPRRSQIANPMSFSPANGPSVKCSSASASFPGGLPLSFGVILTGIVAVVVAFVVMVSSS